MKSFVVFALLAATIATVAGEDYIKALLEIEEAFPGTTGDLPDVAKVVFENGVFLDLGKNITPTECKDQPVTVDWYADKNAYYTIMVVDPDAPSRNNTYMRDILTWLVVNIPGKDITKGDVLAEYVSAAPPKGMGMNRYFYFFYKQKQKQKFDVKPMDKFTIQGRINFSLANFTKEYNLGLPVAVNFLTAYFDPQTNNLYRQLKCCEDLM